MREYSIRRLEKSADDLDTAKINYYEKQNDLQDGIAHLYRAVGVDEFSSIIRTKQFTVLENGLHIKCFGMDLAETLDFANKDFNVDVVAVFEVTISEDILNRIGDFTHVDPYIFKSGTVEIRVENLDEFNREMLSVIHKS